MILCNKQELDRILYGANLDDVEPVMLLCSQPGLSQRLLGIVKSPTNDAGSMERLIVREGSDRKLQFGKSLCQGLSLFFKWLHSILWAYLNKLTCKKKKLYIICINSFITWIKPRSEKILAYFCTHELACSSERGRVHCCASTVTIMAKNSTLLRLLWVVEQKLGYNLEWPYAFSHQLCVDIGEYIVALQLNGQSHDVL